MAGSLAKMVSASTQRCKKPASKNALICWHLLAFRSHFPYPIRLLHTRFFFGSGSHYAPPLALPTSYGLKDNLTFCRMPKFYTLVARAAYSLRVRRYCHRS
jgi:hypothetical protein